MGDSQHYIFSEANLEALLGHLPPDGLSALLVEELRGVSSETEARIRIEGLMQSRLESERGELDAETPIA